MNTKVSYPEKCRDRLEGRAFFLSDFLLPTVSCKTQRGPDTVNNSTSLLDVWEGRDDRVRTKPHPHAWSLLPSVVAKVA